jgi:hypothetical protein
MATRGLFPEVQARKAPEVVLGPELVLLDEEGNFATSFIDTGGRAHLFVTDAKGQLHHIEVQGDRILARELLGVIEANRDLALDAVEYPPGGLRVLAGDRQYIREAPGRDWKEIKGNRCARFVPAGNDLLCALVIKGEEIEAPKRTDVTYGWFLVAPIFFWSNKQASKLALTQESTDGWIIRAVLDPDTVLDADRDFLVGTDTQGTLHFLYGTSTGGRYLFLLPGLHGPGYGAAGPTGPDPELRYAQVAIDRLSPPQDANNQSPGSTTTAWVPIQGTSLPWKPPFLSYESRLAENPLVVSLRPLDRHFVFTKTPGEIKGLMWIVRGQLDDGVRKLDFWNPDNAWVEIGIRDGKWMRGFDVAAAKSLPDSSYNWIEGQFTTDSNAMIKYDLKGNCYAILASYGPNGSMAFLLKNGATWSAASTLGSRCDLCWGDARALATDPSGNAFAAWVNKDHKFVGRWIRPRGVGLP